MLINFHSKHFFVRPSKISLNHVFKTILKVRIAINSILLVHGLKCA